MDANRNMTYPDQEILDAATQEYKVDNQYSLDPVGIKASRLEGNFLNILGVRLSTIILTTALRSLASLSLRCILLLWPWLMQY